MVTHDSRFPRADTERSGTAADAVASRRLRRVARRTPLPRRASGPVSRALRLVDHDPAWSARFTAEAARIAAALGEHASAIEHVGSTAVPGLLGKPVLDLAVAVAGIEAADACIAPLVRLGYGYRGPNGDDERRRYYVRNRRDERVAQIHLYMLPAHAWDEMLAFRDALRADPALAAAYAAEKRRVATAVGWTTTAYSVAKEPFIQHVLAGLRAAGHLAPRGG